MHHHKTFSQSKSPVDTHRKTTHTAIIWLLPYVENSETSCYQLCRHEFSSILQIWMFSIPDLENIKCNTHQTWLGYSHSLDLPNATFSLTWYYHITMTSQWARWRLKSPASRLFIQPFIQVQIKENIKAPRHWPSWGEFTSDRWTPETKGQ